MTSHKTEKQIEKLFNENFHSLVFASFRIVKDYEQAKDIVQNVLVKIWQNFDKLKEHKNLKGYLITAVRNSSLNYLRDYQQLEKNQIAIDGLSTQETEEDIESADKEALITKVHHTVGKLPEKWREAFILSKYEKLKYSEIAEKMNISDKTVEKYISKALSVLRSELKHLISIISIFLMYKL
jgi:RNA polymerase sigma-70 factor (ECF subfamily)